MLMLALLGVTLVQNAQAFYNPSTGRWLSRDPLAEKGGLNLFGFVYNNSANLIDSLGRAPMGFLGQFCQHARLRNSSKTAN